MKHLTSDESALLMFADGDVEPLLRVACQHALMDIGEAESEIERLKGELHQQDDDLQRHFANVTAAEAEIKRLRDEVADTRRELAAERADAQAERDMWKSVLVQHQKAFNLANEGWTDALERLSRLASAYANLREDTMAFRFAKPTPDAKPGDGGGDL